MLGNSTCPFSLLRLHGESLSLIIFVCIQMCGLEWQVYICVHQDRCPDLCVCTGAGKHVCRCVDTCVQVCTHACTNVQRCVCVTRLQHSVFPITIVIPIFVTNITTIISTVTCSPTHPPRRSPAPPHLPLPTLTCICAPCSQLLRDQLQGPRCDRRPETPGIRSLVGPRALGVGRTGPHGRPQGPQNGVPSPGVRI